MSAKPISLGRLLRGGLSGVLLFAGCASTGDTSRPTEVLKPEDRAYLVSPLEGYEKQIGQTTQRRLDEAFGSLVTTGDRLAASQLANELLRNDPEMPPARVLASQVDFVAADYEAAYSRLQPVVVSLPGFVSAQLLLGRSAEKLGEIVEAYEAYRGLAGSSQTADRRAAEIQSRAVEIQVNRIRESLAQGRIEEARHQSERLKRWTPADRQTFEAEVEVARASGDQKAELQALRGLAGGGETNPQIQQRRAELEVEVGDAAVGLRILQDLATANPDDPELDESLARARFYWRLGLLPEAIREIAAKSELSRADFAALLYWLFPEIRYGKTSGARIANDILDHPRREEIVRVVNLGLMGVDSSLHQFEPYTSVRRIEALGSLARLLARHRPPLACLASTSGQAPKSTEAICGGAFECGVLAGTDECLPFAPISGREALEISRRTQELLGPD